MWIAARPSSGITALSLTVTIANAASMSVDVVPVLTANSRVPTVALRQFAGNREAEAIDPRGEATARLTERLAADRLW